MNIEKTKKYLNIVEKILVLKYDLEEEIKNLEIDRELNSKLNLEYELGIKSTPSTYTDLSNILIKIQTDIDYNGTIIDLIDSELRRFESNIKKLTDTEKNIISMRYIDKKNKRKETSFREIANKVNLSKSQVARIHNEAIKTLSEFRLWENSKTGIILKMGQKRDKVGTQLGQNVC